MVIHLCNAFFLSFFPNVVCLSSISIFRGPATCLIHRAHISTFGIFQTFQRGFEKVPKKSVLVKVNDLWVSNQLVQQYFYKNLQEIKAKTNPRQYDALIGVTTADWFHSQGSRALREGITEEERDRFSLSSLPCL